jgi:hypothetical protein
MFDTFSARAIQVVFAARFKAGQRGADTMGVDDLAVALILEDQGMIGSVFAAMIPGDQEPNPILPGETHTPFFPAEIASDLLTKIEERLPQYEPVAPTAEIPISPDLGRAFAAAKSLQQTFHHSQIEPLHLLAALLKESSQFTRLLQHGGITYEQVLQSLRAGNEGPAQ